MNVLMTLLARPPRLLLPTLVISLLAFGCLANRSTPIVPPCPLPSEEFLAELERNEVPEGTQAYLGRILVFCEGLRLMREE